MPELPEVEVLARHLRPLIHGKTIRAVTVRRAKVLLPTLPRKFRRTLPGAEFNGLSRRGKYLLFRLRAKTGGRSISLLGHLGMTGRIFLAPKGRRLPKHTAVALDLGASNLIYEDTRYFGRLTLDTSAVTRLGPEPLDAEFGAETFAQSLERSRQAIKVKLLDQKLVAGVGNIYASEALFRARISPGLAANKLTMTQIRQLRLAIRAVLAEAIKLGSTVPLNLGGNKSGGLFYFGRAPGAPDFYEERLRVYDREGQPCPNCGRPIKRIIQAARSTFYCPHCQRA
ncbi:MAG TPA: bifunctional DNA-formamidopyrimidine glycosylase/DNA-(apurinic or apyrimidinic site) lyase [Verrucomicrobiae bacterium]|nr:bifunctional DNA-formamidopyrimidine glycosylase/DNA-(apurinic or apyrimidinic site) lyase [Verrucomicrobiae bacterium]